MVTQGNDRYKHQAHQTIGLPIRILIAEDSHTQAAQLEDLLEEQGYLVSVAFDGAQGLAKAREFKPHLIISEVAMPVMDGYAMCHAIKHDGELEEIPVILLTALLESKDLIRALQAGADYCITKPFEGDSLLARIKLALEDPIQPASGETDEGLVVDIAGERQMITSGPQQILRLLFSTFENTLNQNWQLVKMQHQLQSLNEQLEEKVRERTQRLQTCFVGITETLSSLVEARDPYTAGHSKNVAALAVEIAKKMGMNEDDREGLWISAMLHDIGKVIISEGILSKPGKLSKHEWGLIQEHPSTAHQILQHVPFPWPIADVIHQHHERLDGSGYPIGIRGDDIHVWARILAVADVVDAMSSHRPYRPKISLQDTINELQRGRTTLYDGSIADTCIGILRHKASRIMILDDDEALVQLLTQVLRRKGLDVSGFCSAKKALEAFEVRPFPVVVTDLWMPEMNGLEIIRRICAIDPTIKVVVISGAGEKEHVVDAMRLGAVDFLEKPVELAVLERVVMKLTNVG